MTDIHEQDYLCPLHNNFSRHISTDYRDTKYRSRCKHFYARTASVPLSALSTAGIWISGEMRRERTENSGSRLERWYRVGDFSPSAFCENPRYQAHAPNKTFPNACGYSLVRIINSRIRCSPTRGTCQRYSRPKRCFHRTAFRGNVIHFRSRTRFIRLFATFCSYPGLPNTLSSLSYR